MCDMSTAAIAVEDADQRALFAAVASAHGFAPVAATAEVPVLLSQLRALRAAPKLWFVSLQCLRRAAAGPSWLIAQMRGFDPFALLVLTTSARHAVAELEHRWARESGAAALLPNLCLARLASAGGELARVFAQLETRWQPRAVASATRAARSPVHAALAASEAAGWPLPKLAAWAESDKGFDVRDRSWRGQPFPNVFVGREAIDRLSALLGCDRATALVLGEQLRRARVFRHVAQAHPLRDGHYFYRFTPVSEKLRALSPRHLAADLAGRGGFECKDRVYGRRRYRECFVGAEAVDWLVAHYALSEDDAVLIGQTMMDLGVLEHVTGDHEFRNGHFFYRFTGLAA